MGREYHKYLVNAGDGSNEGMGICYEAAYISIHGGYLKLKDKNFKLIKEFEVHDDFGLNDYPCCELGVKLIKADEKEVCDE